MIEAAGMQDKFWPTMELVYRSQSVWTENHRVNPGRLWQVLSQAGLDMERLSSDVNDPKIMTIIQQDLADAEALFVRQTPGIFVNGRPLEPFGAEELKALVADEVRAQYPE
jgi:protein-disulfide isomerase